jgi:hypothetical protein
LIPEQRTDNQQCEETAVPTGQFILHSFGLESMKLVKIALIFSVLPFLTGCITSATIHMAKTPVDIVYPDRVSHVEKAVISNDNQLVIYFEGSLSNSVTLRKYTLNIPLKDIGTRPEKLQSYTVYRDAIEFKEGIVALSTVPRDSIHSGWASYTNGNLESVTIKGTSIQLSFPSGSDQPLYYDDSAKLLPNKGRTLYYDEADIVRRDDAWLPPLEFIYVDDSLKQKYTLIYVDQAHVAANNAAVYCFVPIAVPLDIVTAPFQFVSVLYVRWMLGHGA